MGNEQTRALADTAQSTTGKSTGSKRTKTEKPIILKKLSRLTNAVVEGFGRREFIDRELWGKFRKMAECLDEAIGEGYGLSVEVQDAVHELTKPLNERYFFKWSHHVIDHQSTYRAGHGMVGKYAY